MKPTLRTTLIGRLAQRRRPGSLAVLGSSSLLSTTSGCQSQSPSRRPWSSSSNHHQKSFSTGRRMLDIHHRHDPVIRMSRHGFQNTPTRQCSSTGSSSNQDDATTTTTTTTNNITNAFDVLGVPQSFDIDLQKLKQNYRTLMARHHPDVAWQHNDNNNDENNDTTTDAAVITHAYKQLTNPHQRAVHLLELLGHPLEEGTALAVDMEFLQEVISIRERVDAILLEHDHHGHDDDALGGGELRALYEENLQKLQSTCRQLTQAFDVDRNLELAQRWTGELQYWNRIDETIRERLDTTALDDDDNNNNNNKGEES